MLIILKATHEKNECHELKKQEVLSKASLYFILMDVYQQSNDSFDPEFLLVKLKFTVCLIQYNSLSTLNETLSRQYFPCKMKQCKNYLTLMVSCYQYKKNRNVIIINNNNNNDNHDINDDDNNSNNNSNNNNDDKSDTNNSSSNNNK